MAYVPISKTRADRGKLVPFLGSAGQMYPEMGLTFEAPKCVLASVMYGNSYMFRHYIAILRERF
jgi:hypothetical protein